MNVQKINSEMRRSAFRRTALAMAVVAGVGMTGQVLAQATTGTIFGSAPTSGATVQIVGGSGFNRTVAVDSTGHYSLTVPVGNYTVNLLQGGAVVQSHNNVSPSAGGSSEADFVQAGSDNAKSLSTVTVTANALPAIDVASTTQNLTITSKQLAELPLARNAEAIALLAPGTVQGAAAFAGSSPTGGSPISFGGSSIVENAYYINGFNTSDPLSNTGGISLPYGVIDQQQVLTSGYDAKYGRSAGGVISQIGKSGTNDWHFGGQVLWAPAFAQDGYNNWYYSNPNFTPARAGANYQSNEALGQMYQPNKAAGTNQWNTVYDAYISGPLIQDKLFFFLAAESDRTQTNNGVDNVTAGKTYSQRQSQPKYYAKLDWNINDSNILSLTNIYNGWTRDPATYSDYSYDNNTYTKGAFSNYGLEQKNTFDIWIAKYTSYITDDLTLNFLYGKMSGKYYTAFGPDYDADLPNIIAASQQVGAPCSHGCTNSNIYTTVGNPDHTSSVRNLRLDLDWKLGNHDLQFGIDNDNSVDRMDGSQMTGPGYQTNSGYAWSYGPGYVAQYRFSTLTTSVVVKQRAQYIEDNWQVTPNLLLNLGLRNDQFTNYNPAGQAYLRLTSPQWAPRLGFSWDVFGDSSMKVFGNAGRYYLAMPASVALREASTPLYTLTYFSYTGVNADGTPQGIAPLNIGQSGPDGNIYVVNNENGSLVNPKAAAAANLKAEYQDQFVLGMQQQFTMFDQSWVYGVTGTYNKLGRVIDDFDPQVYAGINSNDTVLLDLAKAQGVSINTALLSGSTLINPGSSMVLNVPTTSGGWAQVTMPGSAFNYPKVKRNYYSLDLYLEHVFDGKWYGKIDYVFSRSYGDTEGPTQSNIGQGGSSQSGTEQWDFWQIMQYANGDQANDQKHQLRIYGSYKISPEWMVGATYRIASGTPESCLGWYGPDQTNYQNYASVGTGGGAYHWCGGVPTPPGSTGFTPWTHQLDLQLDYRPAFAGNKLDFQLQVHNVFNEQKVTQISAEYGTTAYSATANTPGPMPDYLSPIGMEAPRYVQFGITYDY